MGLAASQARLLLLTSRKSDLEYRAQCITNTIMILAMQTEAAAKAYSDKISNTALFYRNNTNQTVALSAGNFANTVATIAGAGYTLRNQNGQLLPTTGEKTYKVQTPFTVVETVTGAEGEEPKTITVEYKVGETLSEEQYKALGEDYQKNIAVSESYLNAYDELQLLEALNNGTLVIYGGDGKPLSLSGTTAFTESYYTDDDAVAEAEYKRVTASIQIKEKKLQNDLHQVETQQKACEAEIDSVKKVAEKNIEKTFKVFS